MCLIQLETPNKTIKNNGLVNNNGVVKNWMKIIILWIITLSRRKLWREKRI